MTIRISLSLITLVLILTTPYWIYLPVLFLAIVLLPFFWEGILYAFIIDILYGAGEGFYATPFALIVFLIMLVLPFIRTRLRYYD